MEVGLGGGVYSRSNVTVWQIATYPQDVRPIFFRLSGPG